MLEHARLLPRLAKVSARMCLCLKKDVHLFRKIYRPRMSRKSKYRQKWFNRRQGSTSLMDLCNLKHAELAEHLRKYKGSVVLQEDTVNQGLQQIQSCIHGAGASASPMAAATFSGYNVQTSLHGRSGQRRGVGLHASAPVGSSQIPRKVWIRLPPSRRPQTGRNRRIRGSS